MAYGLAAGAALAGFRALSRMIRPLKLKGLAKNGLSPKLSVVHGGTDSAEDEKTVVGAMTRAAVDALGGMKSLVKKGDTVVIKPNMGWARPPEMGATTNPSVVEALVRMCNEAGARKVKVMDRAVAANPRPAYQASGIARAAAAAGAEVHYVDAGRFVEVQIPDSYVLESWPFYRDIVDGGLCDVLINVPVLKHHGTSRLTIALKNVFGMVGGERGTLHSQIHRKIADLNRIVKVDLTVLDAYRVMRSHGPTGGMAGDIDNSIEGARRIVAGRDPVAVDSYGASLFGYGPEDVGFVRYAAQAGLGNSDWESAGVIEQNI